jgi:hypothetical protein
VGNAPVIFPTCLEDKQVDFSTMRKTAECLLLSVCEQGLEAAETLVQPQGSGPDLVVGLPEAAAEPESNRVVPAVYRSKA